MKRVLLLLMLFALLTGCEKKLGEIKIGVAGPMTGDQAQAGREELNAVTLAVEEWNAKGGLLGKKIIIIEGDDQADPKQAVVIAKRFEAEKVAGVIGHYNSGCSIPASEVYNKANIPQISHRSTNPVLTDRGYINLSRICARDDDIVRFAVEYALSNLKVKKVVVLHDKTTYGQGFADEAIKTISNKVKLLLFEGINKGDADYSTIAKKVFALEPEIIFFGGFSPEAGLIVKKYKELGGKAPLIGGSGIMNDELFKVAGSAAENTLAVDFQGLANRPEARNFVQIYENKFGKPGVSSFYAYDAANILLTAIKTAATVESTKVIEAIRAINHNGVTSQIKFDAKGDPVKPPLAVWKVSGGTFKQID
ncbi:MAG: branched-chain amino acid ABC transporter substrate-binding protein [Methylococcaceae bacterium]